MTWQEYDSPQSLLGAGVAARLARHPYLPLSLLAHAVLFALLYLLRQLPGPDAPAQEADVASSLRATSMASTAKRLQDLETIKQLLEKSADRVEPEIRRAGAVATSGDAGRDGGDARANFRRPSMRSIEEIRAEELAELLGGSCRHRRPSRRPRRPPPRPNYRAWPSCPRRSADSDRRTAGECSDAPLPAASGNLVPSPSARSWRLSEVAALEAKARETLARRQMRLEAESGRRAESKGAARPAPCSHRWRRLAGSAGDSWNGGARRDRRLHRHRRSRRRAAARFSTGGGAARRHRR